MSTKMSNEANEEYLAKMKRRYGAMGTKRARGRVLDGFVEVSGYERKYAIKLLNGKRDGPAGHRGRKSRAGRPRSYGDDVVGVLKALWEVSEMPCGKRLKAVVPEWLPHYERREGELGEELRGKVLAVSPAQIDRLLSPYRVEDGRARARGRRKDAAIRAEVPVRAEAWSVDEPGWLEADTVAHCGGSMAESFIWTLTATDVWSGWTELRATWNRGQYGVIGRLGEMEKAMPFALKGWDTDNGGEFLNWALVSHLKGREPAVEVTRSRPYRKNDQAHVEQKNATHARGLLGYGRLGHDALLAPCNKLLALWSLWGNLFRPTMRQVYRKREGSRFRRAHERRAKTPARRLLESGKLDAGATAALEEALAGHDPFEMKERIEDGLSKLWETCHELDRGEEGARPRQGPPAVSATLRPLAAPAAESPTRKSPEPRHHGVPNYESTTSRLKKASVS